MDAAQQESSVRAMSSQQDRRLALKHSCLPQHSEAQARPATFAGKFSLVLLSRTAIQQLQSSSSPDLQHDACITWLHNLRNKAPAHCTSLLKGPHVQVASIMLLWLRRKLQCRLQPQPRAKLFLLSQSMQDIIRGSAVARNQRLLSA